MINNFINDFFQSKRQYLSYNLVNTPYQKNWLKSIQVLRVLDSGYESYKRSIHSPRSPSII